ncbi:MAG: TonB-dependent receptor [Bryobacterales bacterium]
MRNGDFSQLLPGETIDDPNTGSPFPNNVIPADRIDPVAQTLINLYPDPQNGGLAANFVNQSPSIEDVKKWDTRIDFIPGPKNNFSWRLSAHSFDRPQALTLPPPAYGGGNDQIVEGINTGATWNRILTPNLLLSIRGAWNFGLFKRDNPAAAGGELLNDKYGIHGANNSIPGGFSLQNITGYTNVGLGAFNPVDRDSQNRQLITNLSWTKGSHNIKTGFNFIRSQNNIFNIRHEIGTYAYNGRFTGDGMSDFLLGMASAYTYQTRIQVQLRQALWAGFINDDWKITPKLTFNMGVRYEFVQPWVDKYNRMGVFDITTDPNNPQLYFAEGHTSYTRAGYHSDKNNFMPRLGLAYKLTDRTVIRAGYGMFYTYMEPYGDALYLIGNPPNAYGVGLSSGANDPAVLLRDGPAAGSLELENATGLTFSSYNRSPSLGYAQQWNFNIQHELGANWLFETGYSGSRGAHLLRRYDGNFSPPGPGNINAKRRYNSASIPGTDIVTSPLGEVIYYNQDGNSFYHALVTKIEKRFSSGFTILGSHTWSKNIGDTCGNAASGNTSGCGFQDLRNLTLEHSLDNSDIPHRFVVSGLYELPFGRGKKFGSSMPRALDAVFGGWAVGSIVTHSSGQPYSITIGGNPANTGSHGVVNRPNVNGDPTLDGDQRTLLQDFNTSVFSRQEDYHIGTLGRNTARQRSFFNWDFSALKQFMVTEDVRLQFRFESFHFTNTPRFAQAGNTFGTANFGRITSADTPRNMQFGLKLIW